MVTVSVKHSLPESIRRSVAVPLVPPPEQSFADPAGDGMFVVVDPRIPLFTFVLPSKLPLLEFCDKSAISHSHCGQVPSGGPYSFL